MSKVDKAIKGLENLREAIATDYIRETDQAVRTIDDALELLNEQKHQIWELQELNEHMQDKLAKEGENGGIKLKNGEFEICQ